MNNYVVTHCHTMLSNGVTNIDSVTKYEDYIKQIINNKNMNIRGICFTEHGSIFEWYKKKCACEEFGIKYIHSVEVYVTENLNEKIRDNYHVCLYATDFDSFKELNKLVSKSFNRKDGHYYYAPRITYDELKKTSNKILITTACLGGILGKAKEELQIDFIDFLAKNKDRCYLELQPHMVSQQIFHNKKLYDLHKKYKIPLIVATDTHSLNKEHAKGREILQKSKNIYFDNEDGWDLTLKSYDELVDLFKRQKFISDEKIYESLQNTNNLYDRVEYFKVDKNYKYPKICNNPKKELQDKIKEGIKIKQLNKLPNYNTEYIPKIKYEMKTYEHNKAFDFLLLDANIKEWARENGIHCGYSRGSVSGSEIAYIIGITDIDPIKHKLNFERFMNIERVSLADVDTDWQPNHRELVKNHIYNMEGLHCADIITFNTIALKGAIRDVGRALEIPLNEVGEICSNIEEDGKETEYREKYKELFEYVDIINGTIVSIGTHPCGQVVSSITLDDNMGLCTISTCENPVTMINMKEIDAQNYVKLDILGLDNIQLINETCKLANIERLTPENIKDEEHVWLSMAEDNTCIFQWESDSAKSFLKQLLSKDTIDKIKTKNPNFKYIDLVSMGNGAIRPAGASYRNALSNGEFKDNGHEALNELLKETNGYLVYQEQILSFLHEFCGYTMGEADIVRRGFAKKTGTEQFIPRIKYGFIKTMKDKYKVNEEESEKIVVDFIKVIEDASSYLFSLNHSLPYTYIGYICAYLKYYYPLEFLTVALNINKDKEDKTVKITEYINKCNIKILNPKFRYSKGKYMCDRNTNTIYKGIESIKYLNSECADQLYELRDNTYNKFLDLLSDMNNININSRQIQGLIYLDYFSEFGKTKKILDTYNLYQTLNGKKQIKKDKIKELNLSEDLLKKYSIKETDKTFKFDEDGMNNIIEEISNNFENKHVPLQDKLYMEIEYLGYPITQIKQGSFYYVTEIKEYNNKKSITRYLTMYDLKTLEKVKYKLSDFRLFAENPIKKNQLIKIISSKKTPKRYKDENDKWQIKKGEFNLCMEEWLSYPMSKLIKE